MNVNFYKCFFLFLDYFKTNYLFKSKAKMPATEYPIGEFYSYYPAWNNSGATPTNQPGSSEFYVSDDIVISGVSGRFPEAENIEEFSKYLYGGFNAEFEKKEYCCRYVFFVKMNIITRSDGLFFYAYRILLHG